MMDIKEGKVITDEGLSINPYYTFEEFKLTKFYNEQDEIRIIYLDEKQTLCGRKFIVSLFFKNGVIYMTSLICCDVDIKETEEPKRKKVHDKLLAELGLTQTSVFEWGNITSEYDARSNLSSINITYVVR